MIKSRVKATVYDADGSIVYVADGDVYYPVTKKRMRHVQKDKTFFYTGEIYTLTGDRHGDFLAEGASPDGRYLGTTPPDFTEVTILEEADEILEEEKLRCLMCDKTFSMEMNGPRYALEARKHIVDRQIDPDGKPDRELVDGLLKRS